MLLLLALAGCSGKKNSHDDANKNGVITYHHKDGTLSQETTYRNNVKDGLEKIYFRKGDKVRKEIMFVNGVVEGTVKEYYNEGPLYRKISYAGGKKNGAYETFYKSGKLKSSISYREDYPGADLKEYTEQGELIRQQLPSITVTTVDRLAFKAEYALRLTLSGPYKKVEFYEGSLAEGLFLSNDLFPVTASGNVYEYVSYVTPGNMVTKKLNFIAVVKSRFDNPLVIQKSYNLAVQNTL
jgi:antitoxin component YwqK of YwqJK toxin-antitoxin module